MQHPDRPGPAAHWFDAIILDACRSLCQPEAAVTRPSPNAATTSHPHFAPLAIAIGRMSKKRRTVSESFPAKNRLFCDCNPVVYFILNVLLGGWAQYVMVSLTDPEREMIIHALKCYGNNIESKREWFRVSNMLPKPLLSFSIHNRAMAHGNLAFRILASTKVSICISICEQGSERVLVSLWLVQKSLHQRGNKVLLHLLFCCPTRMHHLHACKLASISETCLVHIVCTRVWHPQACNAYDFFSLQNQAFYTSCIQAICLRFC